MADPKPKPDTGFRGVVIPQTKTAPAPALPPLPPPKSKTTSAGAAFNSFINAHPTMRPYADMIWKYAKVYGNDPTVMAALYWRESFAAAKAQGKDPATITSPKGAVGIGQIMPLHVGEKTPWGHVVSQSDLTNAKFNIQWSSWFFSEQVKKYGSADAAYNQGYNPGYTGPPLTSLLPKGYVPKSGLSPTDKGQVAAETAAATQAAKAQTFDKWAVLTNKGTIQFTNIVDPAKPPKNVLKYGGSPLTQSSFTQVWKQTYQDTYFAYTGRQASGKQIAAILAQSPSIYTLSNQLATDPKSGFDKSPVWKQHAPGLVQYAKGILGNNWKPSGGIIRQAIAQNWDQATFYAHLKQLPAYQKGPEFQDNVAKFTSIAESIYGKPDDSGKALIHSVAKQGWTQDEFASWLRAQPAYEQTAEHKSKQVAFLTQLGLITGATPTVSGSEVDQMLTAQDRLKLPAAKTATATTPPPTTTTTKTAAKPAPELVSEHGQGGGYR
jgi:hypothetical protein